MKSCTNCAEKENTIITELDYPLCNYVVQGVYISGSFQYMFSDPGVDTIHVHKSLKKQLVGYNFNISTQQF